MTAPPAPEPTPFLDLGSVPVTLPPEVTWHLPSGGRPGAAITRLGAIHIWTYSEEQAAQLEAAFAEARRMHRERGQS